MNEVAPVRSDPTPLAPKLRLKASAASTLTCVALLTAGCAGPEEPQQVSKGGGSSSAPTAKNEFFNRPEWSINYSNRGDVDPLVVPEGVLILDDRKVSRLGPDGKTDWSTGVKLFEGEHAAGRGEGLPVLRMLDEETVALVEVGVPTPKGRPGSYLTRVHLISIADGKNKTVELAGTEADSAALTEWGLGFAMPDGRDIVVKPDGGTTQVPAERELQGVLGGHPVFAAGPETSTLNGGTRKVGFDFDGQWNTEDASPLDEHTGVTIAAYSPELAVVKWSWSNPASSQPTRSKSKLMDISTGNVVDDDVPCGPANPELLRSSPGGKYFVAGPVLATSQGATCVGEGSRVSLQAVTDAGVAYGTDGGSDVKVTPDGHVAKSPSNFEGDLLGLVEGDIAIHENDGVITGSKVR